MYINKRNCSGQKKFFIPLTKEPIQDFEHQRYVTTSGRHNANSTPKLPLSTYLLINAHFFGFGVNTFSWLCHINSYGREPHRGAFVTDRSQNRRLNGRPDVFWPSACT